VLQLDWKKLLINEITMFRFIIMLGFLNGHNMLFFKKNGRNLICCCDIRPMWLCLTLRNNFHLSLLLRQIKGSRMYVFISIQIYVCMFWILHVAAVQVGVCGISFAHTVVCT